MEEAGFAAKGLNYRYITAKVLPEDLEAAFAGAKAMNMRGLNLTMPHKIKIIPLLDNLTQAARRAPSRWNAPWLAPLTSPSSTATKPADASWLS